MSGTTDVGALVDALVAEVARRPGTTWSELGIDSLDLLDLVVRCEDALGVALPDPVVARLRGPEDLAHCLHSAAPAPVGG